MNISRFIKKLLNKEDNTYIINMQDAFVLPERSAFNDNPEMISLIDKQKEEYLNILKNKKLFFTKDLSNTLKEEILIKVDIILNEFLKSENKTMDTRVFISKLMLYMNDLINYEKEVLSSSIALKEIITEKIFLSKNKREVLNNELNNLLNLLVILNSQKTAINTRINSYKTEYIYEKHEFDTEELNKRYEYLCFLKEKEIEQIDETQKIIQIALMEKELEEYAYKNTEKIKEIEDDIISINKCEALFIGIYNYVKASNNTYDNYKKIIEKDERQVLIFKEFGKNLISEKKVESFYRKKFEVLTVNIFEEDYIKLNKEDKGYTYYLKIIEEKVNNIFNYNKIGIYQSNANTPNYKFKIEAFSKEIKRKESILEFFKVLLKEANYNYEKLYELILKEKMYLTFLLCTKNDLLLQTFFRRYYVKYSHALFKDEKKSYNCIKLESKVPLDTLIEITNKNNYIEFHSKEFKNKDAYNALCNIYHKWHFNLNDTFCYILPEGIINIYAPIRLCDLIKENVEDINVVFYYSLEKVVDSFFDGIKIKELLLKNKFERIFNGEKVDSYYIKIIHIGQNVEYISNNLIRNDKTLETFKFIDFENSIYLKEHLEELIESLLIFNYLTKDSEITMYGIGFKKECDCKASFEEVVNNDSTENFYEASFKIKNIYLERDGKEYKIDLTKITSQFSFYNKKVLNDFKKYFIEEVEKVTGYNLEANKQIKILNR